MANSGAVSRIGVATYWQRLLYRRCATAEKPNDFTVGAARFERATTCPPDRRSYLISSLQNYAITTRNHLTYGTELVRALVAINTR